MSNSLVQEVQIEAEVGDFFALMKPGVMMLVLWAGLAGIVLAPEPMPLALTLAALLFMAMGSGGAAALNMWYEARLDGLMSRTAARPIPGGRMERGEALGFGVCLSIFSIVAMGAFVNWVAASLLAATIIFYVLIYTMLLKPATAQNIVIGGAAGAAPPLIGWAAATESLSLMPLWMFLIILAWTPPHFWPLALRRKDEYAKAGLPMMPSVRGVRSTANQILFYSGALILTSALPLLSGAGAVYGLVAFVLGAEFMRRAIKLRLNIATEKEESANNSLFFYSMFYLFILFGALMADKFIGAIYVG
jgi:protoheme IX farnesyltransferase